MTRVSDLIARLTGLDWHDQLTTFNRRNVKMKEFTSVVAASTIVLGVSLHEAHAVDIVNLTQNAVLFDDDFEAGTVGVVPGTNDPTVGTWSITVFDGQVLVEDAGSAGFPAYQGQQFSSFSRTNLNPDVYAELDGPNSNGDVMQVTMAVRTVAGQDQAGFGLQFYEGGTRRMQFGLGVNHSVIGSAAGYHDGGSWNTLTAGHNIGEWNVLVMQYEAGASEASVSINGSSFETFDMIGAGVIDRVLFTSLGKPSDYFIDSVPEPASLALLGVGGLMILKRRRI